MLMKVLEQVYFEALAKSHSFFLKSHQTTYFDCEYIQMTPKE